MNLPLFSRGRSRRIALAIAGAVALPLLVLFFFQLATWPEVERYAREMPKTTAFIERYRERQREAKKSDRVAWQPVSYARISAELKLAVLVAEDIDFFSHHGFAVAELKKAVQEAWEEGEMPRGASTLTQQLAKNLWLSPSRNPFRKLKEIVLTRRLESHLKKARILEIYLNVVEFGPGVYGAEAAARHYFGKSAADLTLNEAAQLAAGLPKPSRWHPGSNSATYQRRVRRLERRVERSGL